MSKAAIRHVTKSVAQHCADTQSNIRCNSIHPGDVLTPLMEKLHKEAALQYDSSIEEIAAEGKSLVPLGEYTQPEDIANAVLYLVADTGRAITGTKLIVDGGYVSCGKIPTRI